MNAAILCLAAYVCDVINKTGRCDGSVYYVISLPFSALLWERAVHRGRVPRNTENTLYDRLFCKLLGALSPVSHEGLHCIRAERRLQPISQYSAHRYDRTSTRSLPMEILVHLSRFQGSLHLHLQVPFNEDRFVSAGSFFLFFFLFFFFLSAREVAARKVHDCVFWLKVFSWVVLCSWWLVG